MDENTWRFAQLMMWLIGAQTAFISAVIGFVWSNLSRRLDKIEDKLDKMDEKITDLDKRVVAIETMLHMKDCCMLKDNHLKKAE